MSSAKRRLLSLIAMLAGAYGVQVTMEIIDVAGGISGCDEAPYACYNEHTTATILLELGGENVVGPTSQTGRFGLDYSCESLLEKHPDVIILMEWLSDRSHRPRARRVESRQSETPGDACPDGSAMVAIPAELSTVEVVSRTHASQSGSSKEINDRRAGAKAARGTLEVRNLLRSDGGCHHKHSLSSESLRNLPQPDQFWQIQADEPRVRMANRRFARMVSSS